MTPTDTPSTERPAFTPERIAELRMHYGNEPYCLEHKTPLEFGASDRGGLHYHCTKGDNRHWQATHVINHKGNPAALKLLDEIARLSQERDELRAELAKWKPRPIDVSDIPDFVDPETLNDYD